MIPILVLIFAFLYPDLTPPATAVLVNSGNSSVKFLANSFNLDEFLPLKPATTELPSALKLLRLKYPKLSTLISSKDFLSHYKNVTEKDKVFVEDIDRGPARMPQEYSSKDYGSSSHYRMKEHRRSNKKSFYKSLIQKLLRRKKPNSPSKKEYSPTTSTKPKHSSPKQPMSSDVFYSPGWSGGGSEVGWGWGKGHGHGISLIDLLLCALSLLSLGGFLLNLLLNLMNLFGFGMMTTTATYPVTVTQTATATGTGGGTSTSTGTATGGTGITALGAGTGSGWGITSRNLDSGWGWNGNKAHFKAHIQLPAATTTTTTTTPPPTETGTGTGIEPTETGGTGLTALSLGLRGRRPKREVFKPYVNPSTSLEVMAKAILNTIGSATNKYECMEELFCENNKKARVIGQWLEYFMPVYSFTLSYIGYGRGTHNSLSDHIRAIVLGATETNCHAHYPRCEPTRSVDPSPEPTERRK